MKTRLIALATPLLALLVGSLLIAQESTTTKKTTTETTTTTQKNRSDEDRGARMFRASQLNGLTVQNKANENLAHVDDIVIDLHNGRIVYYAVAYGQVVGFGGKLVAVAPEAMHVDADKNNRPTAFRMEVTKADLENAKPFDSNNWPREPQFGGRKGGTEKSGTLKEKAKEIREEVREGIEKGKEKAGMASELTRISAVFNTAVQGSNGTRLGSLFDTVMDVNNNKVVYAAISHGGTAGVGAKLYAVPWRALEMKSTTLRPGSRVFVINATEEEFKDARGFTSSDSWPAEADSHFKGIRKGSK